MDATKILVTGGTGAQGGSVINALFSSGKELFTLTRNPDSDSAKALSQKGVVILKGDMGDTQSLKSAFEQVDTLFLMGTSFEKGVDHEVEQGINAIDIAKEAGIEYIVYSSVGSADKNTAVPHFDSKYKVEEYLQKSGIKYAISAPVFFYDNIISPWMLPALKEGSLGMAIKPETKLQAISVKNIGEFVALALLNPDKFSGKRIDIAGDELTAPEYAANISDQSAKKIAHYQVPIGMVREQSEDMALMYEWFDSTGYSADVAGLKEKYPEVKWQSFADWAGEQDWSVLG